MNCPSCQASLQEDFKFCPYCGAQVAKISNCFSCGKKVDPSWVSCPFCGAAIKSQQPHPQPHFHIPYKHGHHYSSSSRRRHKKGFLGRIFST